MSTSRVRLVRIALPRASLAAAAGLVLGCGGRVEAADGVAGLTRWTKDGARDPTIGRPCDASYSRAVPVCVPFQDLAP